MLRVVVAALNSDKSPKHYFSSFFILSSFFSWLMMTPMRDFAVVSGIGRRR